MTTNDTNIHTSHSQHLPLSTSLQEWQAISAALREPFDPKVVDFRVQGRANEQTGRAQVVAYIDARVVQDRLDAVVGAGNWSFDWTPLVIDNGEVMVTKGTLTIHGVSKSDAGSASNFEQTLGAVSHCFKRAAVHWGVGRYLYDLPMTWVSVERGGRIPDATISELRAKLPRPKTDNMQTSQTVEGERIVDSPVARPNVSRPRPSNGTDGQSVREPVRREPAAVASATPSGSGVEREQPATEQQLVSIRKLSVALGKPEPDSTLTFAQARQAIAQLSGEYQRARKAS